MNKLYHLDDADLPEIALPIRALYYPEKKPQPIVVPALKKTDRRPGESLHDFLTRKNLMCFCRACVAARKQKAMADTETLV